MEKKQAEIQESSDFVTDPILEQEEGGLPAQETADNTYMETGRREKKRGHEETSTALVPYQGVDTETMYPGHTGNPVAAVDLLTRALEAERQLREQERQQVVALQQQLLDMTVTLNELTSALTTLTRSQSLEAEHRRGDDRQQVGLPAQGQQQAGGQGQTQGQEQCFVQQGRGQKRSTHVTQSRGGYNQLEQQGRLEGRP